MNISKIKEAIECSGLTRKVISERSGITPKTYDNILKGRDTTVSTIEALARVLNVPVGYFFDEQSCDNMQVNTQTNNGQIAKQILTNYPKLAADDAASSIDLKQQLIDTQQQLIDAQARLLALNNPDPNPNNPHHSESQ